MEENFCGSTFLKTKVYIYYSRLIFIGNQLINQSINRWIDRSID